MVAGYFEWTAERVLELRRLWLEEGMSAGYIARLWGNITRNAIIGKIHRQGWQRNFGASGLTLTSYPRVRLEVGEGDQRERVLDRLRRQQRRPAAKDDLVVERVRPRAKTLVQTALALGITVDELKERRQRKRERAQLGRQAQLGQQAPPPLLLKVAVVRPPGPVDLLRLAADDCRWIMGEVAGPATLFCGAPKAAGSSYCGEHARRAFARRREAA